jgi:hypothetical protein
LGLRGAAAALLAGVAGGLAGLVSAEAKQQRNPGGGPWAAGPCGPKRSDNACKKDGDCCTKYCQKGAGARRGHCRCVKPGQACKKGQSCCSGSICYEGLCIRNTPSKICTVCAKNCAYSSVNAAYAAAKPGDTISIGVGTWPTGIMVSKNIRLTACEGMAGVRLVPDGSVTDSVKPAIIVSNPNDPAAYTVTLDGLEFAGSGKDNEESLIYTVDNNNISFRIIDCAFSDAWAGLNLGNGNQTVAGSTFTRSFYGATMTLTDGAATIVSSSFTGCDSYGFYAMGNFEVANRQKSVFQFSDCEFSGNGGTGLIVYGGIGIATGCTLTGNASSGAGVQWGDLTLHNSTVSENTADDWGGGVYLYSDTYSGLGDDTSLTLLGTTTITGNTAPDASGIGVEENGTKSSTVTGASSSNVYGNLVGDQCETSTDTTTWTNVPNCAF